MSCGSYSQTCRRWAQEPLQVWQIGLLLKERTRDGPDVGHGARRPVKLGRIQLRHAMARAEAADIGRAGDGRKLDGPIAAILSCGGEPQVMSLFMTINSETIM